MRKISQTHIFLAVAALIFISALVVGYFWVVPAVTAGSKDIKIEIIIPDKDTKTVNISTDAEYLRQALDEKKLIDGDETSFGFMVTTVNGVKADDSKQEWWAISKNGVMLDTGVDEAPIANGDKFEFTLSVW